MQERERTGEKRQNGRAAESRKLLVVGHCWPRRCCWPSGAGADAEAASHLARVKDVATIEGIRDNQLVGYGLVVGLRGHGDSSQTVFPAQTLLSALERMGITVPQTGANSASNMQVKNMAAVFVVATLPPFSRPGYKVDITVSSAGDARSLEGGVLLMTPLYGPDGQIYAQAQGALVLGGYMATGGGNTKLSNHPTTARIPGGALVERPVPFDLKQMHTVSVVLNDADFHTAGRMAAAIDRELGLGAHTPSIAGGWRLPPRRARMWHCCWTEWRRSRSMSIRGRGWWSMSAPERW
jgi:flagellar basal body P-ring protein FlgI